AQYQPSLTPPNSGDDVRQVFMRIASRTELLEAGRSMPSQNRRRDQVTRAIERLCGMCGHEGLVPGGIVGDSARAQTTAIGKVRCFSVQIANKFGAIGSVPWSPDRFVTRHSMERGLMRF